MRFSSPVAHNEICGKFADNLLVDSIYPRNYCISEYVLLSNFGNQGRGRYMAFFMNLEREGGFDRTMVTIGGMNEKINLVKICGSFQLCSTVPDFHLSSRERSCWKLFLAFGV